MKTEDYDPTKKSSVESLSPQKSEGVDTDPKETPSTRQADEVSQEILPAVTDGSLESQWLPGDVDKFVEHLNQIFLQHVERGMEEIGKTVLNGIFHGDTKAASSRNPWKKESYKRLCNHPDLRLDPRRLGESVKVAAFTLEMEQKGYFFGHLTFTHKIHLVRIPDESRRLSLALDAEKNRYSVATVEDRVRDQCGRGDIGRAVIKAIKSPHSCIRYRNVLESRTELSKLRKADRIELRREAAAKRDELLEHCKFLGLIDSALFDIESEERKKLDLPAEDDPGVTEPEEEAPSPGEEPDKTVA